MKEETNVITLYLIDGSTIDITHPVNVFEEIYEEMRFAIEQGTLWNVGGWSNTSAKWKDHYPQNINCKLVVGYS